MELKDFYKAEIVTANFEENTITFVIEGDFSVRAGKYFIFKKEALQNFTDKICEKQRDLCADRAYTSKREGKDLYSYVANTEQPKLEDL